MLSAVFAISSSVAITSWIIFCCVVYAWHYFIEVVLDLPVIGESPCSTHAGLKLLIQRIIQEAIGLPTLKRVPDHPGKPSEEINRTYEDLLATAIINKVIANYQDELPSSSANSVSSRRSNLSVPNNKEYFFGEETLDSKWRNCHSNVGDVDTTSASSVEEWIRSDSSSSSTKYVDHASLTIQQRIEETLSSDEEQVIENKNKEWQENWKLQKRQFAGTASPIPVPMLVPNPTIEAKVLIGDREAEDTTDLSDAGSEYDDAEREDKVENVLPGKNLELRQVNSVEIENNILSDGSTDDSDIVKEKERIFEEFTSYHDDDDVNVIISESINQEVINHTETIEDTSLGSHIEQDTEYTEKYATLPRTICKPSKPVESDASNLNSFPVENINDVPDSKNYETTINKEEQLSVDEEFREKFKGTYSEREKQKWQNAVEMKNNPYTEENINRRLYKTPNGSSTPIFGRDYYIKEASKATGARNAKIDVDDVVSGKLQESTNESNTTPSFIFKAVPAFIDSEGSGNIESPIEIPSPISASLLEISTDSDLSIERTYNLDTGTIFEKKGNIQKQITKRSTSPEGLKFTATDTEISAVVDENHNAMTQDRKRTFLRSLTQSDESKEIDISETSDDVFNENSISNVINNNNNNDVPLIINEIKPQEEDSPKKSDVESIDYVVNNKTFSIQEVSMDFSTEGEEVKTTPESSLNSNPDIEIVGLKDKHLVKDRLGQFSKSYPNLASVPLRKTNKHMEDCFVGEDKHIAHVVPESKEDSPMSNLKKRFSASKEEIMVKQVHSLTARSISQVIRKELQEIEHSNPEHVTISQKPVPPQAIISQVTTTTVTEEDAPEELPIFPNAKSRIKFFENLNR